MPENSLKNKTDYKRLGDYIREVDSRNRDLAVTKLMGINIGKFFMPSVANVIGTDLSNYKVVFRNCFACNLMHVGRDEKIPIALHDTDEKIIISPAYFVFEISKPEELLPAYLMMWFRRSEFDRNAWFYTDSDVRGGMSKDAFCDLKLPIPPISRQREIVAEYETLTRRIRLNERLISTLESAAQTLYRRTFVENIDPARLPPGWRTGTLGEIAEINPRLSIKKGEEAFFVEMEALPTKGFFIQEIQRREFSGGAKFQNGDILFARITPCMENGKVAVASEIPQNEVAFGSTEFIVLRGRSFSLSAFLATLVRNEDFRSYAKSHMKGTDGRQRVDSSALEVYKVLIPPEEELTAIESKLSSLIGLSLSYMRENKTLTKIQNLLLARIGE